MFHSAPTYYYLRIISDIVITCSVFFWAGVVFHVQVPVLDTTGLMMSTFMIGLTWFVSSKVNQLYDDFRSRDFSHELVAIMKNMIAQVIVAIVLFYVVRLDIMNRTQLLAFALFSSVGVTIKSYVFRKILAFARRRGMNIRKLLIVGAGNVGVRFSDFIKENPHFGYKCVGFLDDQHNPAANGSILGPVEDLAQVIVRREIQDVVVALPNTSTKKIQRVVEVCLAHTIRVRIIPDYFDFLHRHYRVVSFGNFPLLTVRTEPLDEPLWRLLKRCFDVFFSIIVIGFVLSWLLPVLYVIQKLLSPGPFLFAQERIGYRNRTFNCIKIRTMHVKNPNEGETFAPTLKGDKRVTSYGRFLRRSNLDELPQFFNVLKGDMSVVGPRPHAVLFNQKYAQFVNRVNMRHSVKPGITGWAQINGLRGDVADETENRKRVIARINYDLWYIENWSFGRDIQIIYSTILQIVKGKNRGE